MRMLIAIMGFVLASGACVACAQGQGDSPTEVGKIGFYTCPSHPQIQATWPAQCPACQHVLQETQPSTATALGAALIADRDRDETRERQQREEAQERQRNEERRERQLNEERRERQRNEEYGERGYYPYNFPYGSRYGGSDYAGRPYYNPSYGYYNPNTGYYFNPNTGYYYNPDTGEGYYAQNYNPNAYPYYGYNYPGYGYNYSNEEARERANRQREERRERDHD